MADLDHEEVQDDAMSAAAASEVGEPPVILEDEASSEDDESSLPRARRRVEADMDSFLDMLEDVNQPKSKARSRASGSAAAAAATAPALTGLPVPPVTPRPLRKPPMPSIALAQPNGGASSPGSTPGRSSSALGVSPAAVPFAPSPASGTMFL